MNKDLKCKDNDSTAKQFPLTPVSFGIEVNPHWLQTVFLQSVQVLKLGGSLEPMLSPTLQSGQVDWPALGAAWEAAAFRGSDGALSTLACTDGEALAC